MNLKKFRVPLALLFITILFNQLGRIFAGEEGEIITPSNGTLSIFFTCCSFPMLLITIIYFAYSLGYKEEKAELEQISQEDNNEKENNKIKKSNEDNGETAREIAFLIMLGSILAIILMIIFGFLTILQSLGPGLGFSGGTCDGFCNVTEGLTIISGGFSILLFIAGLITLARPWSWIPDSWLSKLRQNK